MEYPVCDHPALYDLDSVEVGANQVTKRIHDETRHLNIRASDAYK
jgi:hypothetical protein